MLKTLHFKKFNEYAVHCQKCFLLVKNYLRNVIRKTLANQGEVPVYVQIEYTGPMIRAPYLSSPIYLFFDLASNKIPRVC